MDICLICEKKFKSSGRVEARDGYYYLICAFCTGGILMPRERALSQLSRAYESTYFDWQEAKGLRRYLHKLTLFLPYPQWIQRTYPKKGTLLDVGAGVPDFVYTMVNNGWNSFALEISKDQVTLIRKFIKTKNVWQGDFEKKNIPLRAFDVITFWHMLEHLAQPAKAIRKSAKVLKKNGMLFAEFPNLDSLNLQLFKQDYCHFDLPGHLVYYNQKSLKYLFEQNGFKNIQISYPLKLNGSFSLNLMKSIIKITNNYFLGISIFYLTLPLSLIMSVINSYLGKTDLMRISAVKS